MNTYKNPWHKTTNNMYGPSYYHTNAEPTRYKGYLIYERIAGTVWDVVKDGVCITQLAGPNGARSFIDEARP
jgi:hypothetical protein